MTPTLADEEALTDFLYEIQDYSAAKAKAKLLWPLLSRAPLPGRKALARKLEQHALNCEVDGMHVTGQDLRAAASLLRTLPGEAGINTSQDRAPLTDVNASQLGPRFPQQEADVPARRVECSEPRSGHDHD